MGPFDRTVTTRYEAKVDGYLANVARMKTATADVAKEIAGSATKSKADWDKIGNGAAIAGAAITAGLGAAVVTAARFEKSMSGVAAALDDGTRSTAAMARESEALREAALQAGADTVFSAMEAAQAEAELARAGLATADILGGALAGSLDLAAAGQVSLAQSSETVANALNIFDLAGEDATRVADTLTAGANKSAAGVDDLRMALAQGGGAAAQLNLTVEDTVGVLAAFADNALKGSDAGTSLRTMLGRLNPTTEEAAGAMTALGLDFYDSTGAFVGIEAVAGQLQAALGNLSEEERNLAVQTIFGQDAQRGANILIDEGAEGIGRYIDGVTDLGAAQRAAARQTDNLAGDVERLKGSIETAKITAGEFLRPMIEEATETLDGLVQKFTELPSGIQESIVTAAALAGAVLLVGGAGIKATVAILEMRAALTAAGISGARLATIMKTAGAAALAVGVAMAANEIGQYIGASQVAEVATEELAESIGHLSASMDEMGNKARGRGAIEELFANDGSLTYGPEGFGFSEEEWVSAGEVVERFAIRAQNALGEDLSSTIRRFQDFGASGAKFEETVGEIDRALAEMVNSGNAEGAANFVDDLLGGIADPAVRDKVRDFLTGYQEALDGVSQAQLDAASGADGVSENLNAVAEKAAEAKAEVDDYIGSLVAAGLLVLDQRATNRAFEESLDAITERTRDRVRVEKELKDAQNRKVDTASERKDKAEDIARLKEELAGLAVSFEDGTEAGRAQNELLDDVARNALAVAEKTYEATGSENAFRQSLLDSRPHLVKAAEDLGLGKEAAEKFADGVLNIPPHKEVKVKHNLDPAIAKAQAMEDRMNALDGKTATATLTVHTSYTGQATGRFDTSGVGYHAGQAEGGYITGPGTATSDSIATWLSNGEYVIKAAAVAKYGVHLFDRLNAMRLASGGLVTPYRGSVAAPSYYSTTTGPSSQSTSNDNRLVVQELVVRADNPRQMRRELRREAAYGANVAAS